MEKIRIIINISREERDALLRLAEQEVRDPRDQAGLIIRKALIDAGFLDQKIHQAKKHTNNAACAFSKSR